MAWYDARREGLGLLLLLAVRATSRLTMRWGCSLSPLEAAAGLLDGPYVKPRGIPGDIREYHQG
jgi:hypothetical protein